MRCGTMVDATHRGIAIDKEQGAKSQRGYALI